MTTEKQKFVLLDRDGVINRWICGGYVTSWKEFEFLPEALQALRLLAESGYAALVVSNQACVGKGLLSERELHSITNRFVGEVSAFGGDIRGVYYCTHRADAGCACRKPQAGLLRKAQAEHGFQFADTFVVGDSGSDIEAAHQVGSPALLVSSNTETDHADLPPKVKFVRSLYEAAEIIIATEPEGSRPLTGQGTGVSIQ
jgi:D-glycero-D-manno-heptose 1,7-bisphosphate phosphatase